MLSKSGNPIIELAGKGYDFEVCAGQANPKNSILDLYNQMSEKLQDVPWLDLEKRGWVKSGRNILSLAPFASSFIEDSKGNALFRKSSNVNETLISFWLTQVATQAKMKFIDSPNARFHRDAFNKDELVKIAKQSINIRSIKELPDYLQQFGILLIYERGVPGLKADGAVMKLENGSPVIGMSLRFSRLDNFWFTLMHELSHIVLHYDQIETPIVDDIESQNVDALETAANRLAQNTFVPRSIWNRCPPKYEQSESSIRKFAKEEGIHPAIVAGMLQKETNNYKRYRSIVDSVNVIDIIEGSV